MKRHWGTIALLSVAVLLSLYFVVIENPRQRARLDRQHSESLVLALKEEDVAGLEIQTPSGRVVLDRGDGGRWRLSDPVSAEADDMTVRRLLRQVTSMSVIRAIDGVGNLADVGLEKPAVRVVVRRNDGRSEVAFGNEAPTGSGVYVQRDDQKVFLTSAAAKTTFEVSQNDVRRKEFVDFQPEAVTRIGIVNRGRTLRLTREGGEWRTLDPPRTADPEKVASLLSRLRALRATGFADTDAERRAVGLDAKARTQIELTAGQEVVRVAFHRAADGSLYARAAGETLYRVSDGVVDELPLDAEALRDMRLVRAAFDDVRALEVERPEERYRVSRSGEGWELDGRGLKPDATREVEALIRTLVSLRGESVAAETLREASPALFAAPAARLTLRGADDRVVAALTIGEKSGERRYASTESSAPVFLIASDVLDRVPRKSALAADTASGS